MSDGFARAALKLYEMGDAERNWVLMQLEDADREKLRRLLDRIDSRNARGTEPVMGPGNDQTPPLRPSRPAEEISSASVERIAEVLAVEADWVIALVMSRRDWPWSRDFLEQLDPDRVLPLRAAIGAAAAQASEAAMDAAVCALEKRLRCVELNVPNGNAFEDVLARLTGFSPGQARHAEGA